MKYLEAVRKSVNGKDNFVCLNDKHRGWIVWAKGSKFPVILGNRKEISNPKSVSILKKDINWQIADIPFKFQDEVCKSADLSKYVMNVVSLSNDAW